MKTLLTLIGAIICMHSLKAQNRYLTAGAGLCINGTGDTKGILYTAEYKRYIGKSSFFWGVSADGTIHDGFFPILYEYPAGHLNDGSVHYTIAGIQATGFGGLNFLRSRKQELYLTAGGLVRYQSSSYWDLLHVLYPGATGLPYPVVVFENSTPQRTLAAGISLHTGYSYTMRKGFTMGLALGFQFDTQGDNISSLVLKLGKRF